MCRTRPAIHVQRTANLRAQLGDASLAAIMKNILEIMDSGINLPIS
jgi:hypothetical protein